MSALNFIKNGGMATVGGDLPNDVQKQCNEFLKKFLSALDLVIQTKRIPRRSVKILSLNGLYVAKDKTKYSFVMYQNITSPQDNIQYQDLSKYGVVPITELSAEIQQELGDTHWYMEVPISIIDTLTVDKLVPLAEKYFTDIRELEIQNKKQEIMGQYPTDIRDYVGDFNNWHKGKRTAFIIMPFDNDKAHADIVRIVKETLLKHNIIGLRADDREFANDLFSNVKLYMHCCDFGIAVFERIKNEVFNPNVSLEAGYMMGLNKNVCLLKDETMQNLPTDLVGRLYKSFDTRDVESTLPKQLEVWLRDKGFIKRE